MAVFDPSPLPPERDITEMPPTDPPVEAKPTVRWHEHDDFHPDDLPAHLVGYHGTDAASVGAWPDTKALDIHEHLHIEVGHINHLMEVHERDRSVEDYTSRERVGIHARLHATGLLHTAAERTDLPRVAPTAHQPDKKAHSHEGHWPTAEEARFHLVYAHGWDPVRASSLYLPDAELSHHDEHTRIDRPLIDRLRKADTHPVNVLAHMPIPGHIGETTQRQRILAQYTADVIAYLQGEESVHNGVWVMVDKDGLDAVASDLREIEEMRNDDQYLGAHQLAANIDKLLGITP